MKWILFLLIAVTCFSPLAAGQYATNTTTTNLFSFQLFGPHTVIKVANDTDDNSPIIPGVGDIKSHGPLYTGDTWEVKFDLGQWGDSTLYVDTCDAISPEYVLQTAPHWAADTRTLGGLALTNEYLRTNPTKSELKERLRQIDGVIKPQTGYKFKKEDLKVWAKEVERNGISYQGGTCTNPRPIGQDVSISQWGYEHWDTLVVRGNRKDGYRLQYIGPRSR